MKVYVDYMLVKSIKSGNHTTDLVKCFEILKKYNMKLNPKKCSFGVSSRKFLGFIVNARGIEANPEKIKALIEMPSPTKLKEVLALTGRMAALNRFISKSIDKCLPFFNVLRVLARPITGETLLLYLAVSDNAISAARVQEEGKHQQSVYYVSKRLLGLESRFLSKPDASGRLIKWSIELGQFDITYYPRTSIKGQALAAFLIKGITLEENPLVYRDADTWKLYLDGASNEHGLGAGVILIFLESFKFHYALRFQFVSSNNEAKYEALIACLKIAEVLKVKNLVCYSDSQLIVNQVLGECQAKGIKMAKYLEKDRKNLEKFDYFKIEQIPREQNSNVDALAKLTSQNELD
ncbi:hypothetical protein CsatB_008235 [Cannabis sativa]|uniref:uncharacterized protein LOC133032344 n=1 Tax=Cannabis sativa TaxID=3483 RepID=UPI0029CA910E|nr:uncharacterized protein LOC133032344 [Cannabis sativa]